MPFWMHMTSFLPSFLASQTSDLHRYQREGLLHTSAMYDS
jgi:hypothetical protein